MDEIKRIGEEEFNNIAYKFTFSKKLLTKDYFITLLLYLIRNVEGIYFKGGTAIQRIYSKLFEKITEDKNVEGFLRIMVFYKGFSGEKDCISIDLNKRATLLLKPETHVINHFYYPFIPEFSLKTLAKEEMIAEKIKAAITRNKLKELRFE